MERIRKAIRIMDMKTGTETQTQMETEMDL